MLFVFLNRARNRVKILYWESNGFCLCSTELSAGRFQPLAQLSVPGVEAALRAPEPA